MTTTATLQKGDRVPHFEVAQSDGTRVSYATGIWQHRNLLLVSIGDDESAVVQETVADLRERAEDIESLEAVCLVTRDQVPGVPTPGMVIADRWGEIFRVADAASWMRADDVVDWLQYLQYKCPECEGEAK
jgi:hypothetical protein